MKIIKKTGQVVVIILVAYFIIQVIIKNWTAVRQSLFDLNVFKLSLAVILMAASFTLMIYLWHIIIKCYNRGINFTQSWYIYMKAAIIRYIPGNIWGLTAKAYMLTKLGLNKSEAVFIMIFESAILILSGILTYFLTIAYLGSWLINISLALLAILLFIFISKPKVYLRILRLIYSQINIKILPLPLVLKLLGGYLMYWLICGFSFYYLIESVTAVGPAKILIATGIFAVSWVLGFLSLITPSGLGIREISLIYFLGKIMVMTPATIITLLARLIYVIGELISFGLSYLLANRQSVNTDKKIDG